VVIGKDADGDEMSTLIVETIRKEMAEPAKAPKQVPRAQRLLMSVITDAIDEAGFQFAAFSDGPLVRGVKDAIARARYYARIAEPEDDEDAGKASDRKRKAWKRAVKAALDARDLMAVERDGGRLLWKP
jgi:hypothetical protein